ncbi:hypothetical protein ACQ4PT_004157 [Festuca glaucescens]
METPVACEFERLPEDLLVHVISLTSPGDAFRATAVSRAFHAAADSDSVWSRFLPSDLPRFAKKELPRTPPSTKKGLFRRLSDEPVLLPRKFMRMQLDKATGAKCLTLSASTLQIPPHSSRRNWIRVGLDFDYSKRGKRFLQAAGLGYMQGLDIRAKEASFGIAGSESTRQVCLQGYAEDGDGADEPPRNHILPSYYYPIRDAIPHPGDDVHFPPKKTDGWMEVELGEFHNEEGDGEISISLVQTAHGKCGLIVWGIELRSKQQW